MNNSSNNNSKRMKCRFQKLLEYDRLTYVPKSIMLFLQNTWISISSMRISEKKIKRQGGATLLKNHQMLSVRIQY